MKWLFNIFNKGAKKEKRENSLNKQEQALFRIGREQFIRLKEKGLNIPIFTL